MNQNKIGPENGQATSPRTFAIVSWSGGEPIHLSPRGQRTQHLINTLQTYGCVERIGAEKIPNWLAGDIDRPTSSWYRRLARVVVYSCLIDKYEIAAWRKLHRWQPNVDAAVLVGYPCSPLSVATRRLVKKDIPYVVDIGDPWILTNPNPEGGWLRKWRARRQEQRLWSSAAGVVVTTQGQGEALKHLFPHLQVLVRPNGYYPKDLGTPEKLVPDDPIAVHRSVGGDAELRLVHYGSLYGERVNFRRILRRLADSNQWRKITLFQYGPDWEDALASVSDIVEVERRAPITWKKVLAEARTFDAAVVIGWSDPTKMPSKAIQYLTLPIPRVAMASCSDADALAAYVTDKPGWTVVDEQCDDAAQIIADLASRTWTAAELKAPESESWSSVENVLGEFVSITTRLP